jgi:hypothetical protein
MIGRQNQMATRRRVRRRSLKGSILDIQRRLRYVESKPNPFKISDKAITRDALQFNAVSSDQIAPNAIGTEEISSDAVTNDQLADGSVSNDTLQSGSVGSSNIQDGAVTTSKIANSAVTTEKIANSAVTTDKINNFAVTTAKIGDGQVTAAKIGDGQVTTAKIGNDQITSAKVATGQIGGRGDGGKIHIRANSITTQDILNGAIGSGKLATDAVITVKIANGNVTEAKLASNSVTNAKISDGSVTFAKINSNTVGTGSTRVARGDHGHTSSINSVNENTTLVSGHRHSYQRATSVSISSTKKLKKDIQDYTFDINKILKVQLKKFKYLNQAKNKRLNREWEYGYIAEEIQELGLEEILGYDNNGEPNSINYPILSVFAIELLKEQQKQIDFLTKEIEKLKETK